jgi:hypothetical protein
MLGEGMRLVYKGAGDYDLIAGPVTIELSYDGTDCRAGRWTFWNVKLGEDRFGGTGVLGVHSELVAWLEEDARGADGRLRRHNELSVA